MKSCLILFCVTGILAAVSEAATGSTDYCKLPCKVQQDGRVVLLTHIACNHSKEFQCKNAADAKIPQDLKNLIVKSHNEHRNFVAGGNDPNHDPACRMATMQWDDELANLAALNVKQCKMQHDQCRQTVAFPYAGQNLWIGMKKPDKFTTEEAFKRAIKDWYSEIGNSTREYTKKFVSGKGKNGGQIGHFTAMMKEDNTHVGCALATYPVDDWNTALIACNYASTNMLTEPIYKVCQKPATECTTGTNPDYKSLCSKNEKYER